jgi:hypothetical protein
MVKYPQKPFRNYLMDGFFGKVSENDHENAQKTAEILEKPGVFNTVFRETFGRH